MYTELHCHSAYSFLDGASEPAELAAAFGRLEDEARAQLAAEGFAGAAVRLERSADCRYQGQSFELTVPLPAGSDGEAARHLAEAFAREHERTYGHKAEGDPIQVVNLRLTARVRGGERAAMRLGDVDRPPRAERQAYFGPAHGLLATPVIALLVSTLFEGYRWTWVAGLGVLLAVLGNWLALRPAPDAAAPRDGEATPAAASRRR